MIDPECDERTDKKSVIGYLFPWLFNGFIFLLKLQMLNKFVEPDHSS